MILALIIWLTASSIFMFGYAFGHAMGARYGSEIPEGNFQIPLYTKADTPTEAVLKAMGKVMEGENE